MRRNLLIIGLTVFVILLVAFLTVRLHRTSEKEVLSQFQAHQLLQAEHVAILIKSYFENRSNGLKALSSYDSLQYGWPQQRKTDLRAYLESLRKIHVKAILLYDQTGRMIESVGDQPVGWDHLPGDLIKWAHRKENKGRVFVLPLPQNSSSHSFQALLAIPLYREDSRILSFFSLYIYELPTHHCPFCILQGEYGYVGYPLYVALLGGGVTGMGVGLLMPFRDVESLSGALSSIQRRLVLISLILYLIFAGMVFSGVIASDLILEV
jgi:hypothetical protein